MSQAGYRIDYDRIDVLDLMEQVRARVAAREPGDPALPTTADDVRARMAEYLCLDDQRPYEMEHSLGLGSDWNLSPLDLRRSHAGPLGALIRATRTMMRPLAKLVANIELPLFKQFKVNLGLATALGDLLEHNARLNGRIEELSRRLDKLEARRGETRRDA